MGKHKKEKLEGENLDDSQVNGGDDPDVSYEEKLAGVNAIAQPIASRKLAGRIYKLLKKASQHEGCLYDGLKEVQARIRKGVRGIVILAGNVSPIDVMCHVPGVCEEKELPYIYTPSKEDLGTAMGHNRCSIMAIIREHSDYKELYDKVLEDINKVSKVF